MPIAQGTPRENISDPEAWGQIVIHSDIWPLPLKSFPFFRGLVRAAKLEIAKEMISTHGPIRIVTRNLVGSDLGLTPRHWNETVTATENAWEDSGIAAATTPANSAMAIFGVVDLSTQQGVSAIRIEPAGARPREWDLQYGFNPWGPAAVGPIDLSRYYIGEPLIIGESKTITVRYYVRGGVAVNLQPVELPLLGIIGERESAGSGLSGGR